MKIRAKYIWLLLLILHLLGYGKNEDIRPVFKGPYLGQKPPGIKAVLFAPGIVSTEKNESLFGFFNSGKLLLFSRTAPDFDDWRNEPVYIMEQRDGNWTEPKLSAFIGKPWYLNLPLLPSGETLYFARWGGGNGKVDPKNLDIWKVRCTEDGWSEPRRLPPPINSNTIDTCPSVSQNNTLYFFSGRKGGLGRDDIYRVRLIDGEREPVENLGLSVNSEFNDIDPYIAPDESYLIFCSNRPDGFGEIDLYVSFLRMDGSWTKAVNLGKAVNSPAYDWIPFISGDGKYLFFTSNRTGNFDVYWVDIRIVKKFKPKKLK